MIEESSRLFSIACSIASGDDNFVELDSSLGFEFEITFRRLSRSFGWGLRFQISAAAEAQSIYFLLASTSYIKLMSKRTKIADFSVRMRDLLQKTRELLIANFDMLPDPTPRGPDFEFCEKLHRRLAEMKPGKKMSLMRD